MEEEKNKSERRRQTEEERGGKERKSVHVPLWTQPRAATPLSLSISVCGAERRSVIRKQGRESVMPTPHHLLKHDARCLGNHTTTLMCKTRPLMLS